MASSKIVKYTSEELEEKRLRGESKTDWERVRKTKDEEIDYTDSPELDDSFFKRAVVAMPVPKKPITSFGGAQIILGDSVPRRLAASAHADSRLKQYRPTRITLGWILFDFPDKMPSEIAMGGIASETGRYCTSHPECY